MLDQIRSSSRDYLHTLMAIANGISGAAYISHPIDFSQILTTVVPISSERSALSIVHEWHCPHVVVNKVEVDPFTHS
jgi:hypothetical protein